MKANQYISRCVMKCLLVLLTSSMLELGQAQDAGLNSQLPSGDSATALIAVVLKGNVDEVKTLLDKGVHVDAKDSFGRTALMIAARYRSNEIVRLLLNHGAQVNATNTDGYTPLMAAALGYVDTVELLLSEGAEVNATTKRGATALMLAADAVRYGPIEKFKYTTSEAKKREITLESRKVIANYEEKTKIINLLLAKGANVNTQTKTGTTALLRAVHSAATDTVRLLLEKGANPNLADDEEGTPIQLAIRLRDKWAGLDQKYKTGQWAALELQARRILALLEHSVAK